MRYKLTAILFIVMLGMGCISAENTPPTPVIALDQPTRAPTPTLYIPPATPSPQPQPTPNPLETWQPIEPGLEQRQIKLLADTIMLMRIDPNLFRFDVAYSPTEPKLLEQWLQDTNALIVVNGGYFTAEYYATGLTIVDGVSSGVSYDYGGMVAIQDGYATVRSMAQQPYNASEAIDAGLQAFPMLVQPGGVQGFNEETGRQARRTVIAQDRDGKIILLITTRTSFTLYELSRYLVQSDLNIDRALNLDGGPSSGLLHRDGFGDVPTPIQLPTVLTINRR